MRKRMKSKGEDPVFLVAEQEDHGLVLVGLTTVVKTRKTEPVVPG